jgi:hypothetical protein
MSEIEEPFKTCPMCGYVWPSIESFVLDVALRVEGYQADFEVVEDGLFMLTHVCPGCHSTLAVRVEPFGSLTSTPRDYPLKLLTNECEGHCLSKDDFAPCASQCKMRWVRDVLTILHEHKLPFHIEVTDHPQERIE